MRKFIYRWMGLWRTLAIAFALVFVFAYTVGAILEANSSQVNRVLGTQTTRFATGEDAYTLYTPDYTTSDQLKAKHIELGTQVGAEGSVLLQNKNDSALPLKDGAKVTLFGVSSTAKGTFYGMGMGGSVNDAQSVSLSAALDSRGFQVNPDMSRFYESSFTKRSSLSISLGDVSVEPAYDSYVEVQPDMSKMGAYTDAGIVVIGRPSSEGGDYFPGALGVADSSSGAMLTQSDARSPLALTSQELSMIDAANEKCDKVVVLINSCNPLELGEIMTGSKHAVDAILWIGFPGNYGLYGVADILAGNSNPSGHLADTYAKNSTSAPAMQNFGIYHFTNSSTVTANKEDIRAGYYLVEAEGIYTGYKYYETRYEDAVLGNGHASESAGAFDSKSGWTYGQEMAFPFGYGKSYTTFTQEIKDVQFSEDYREATVTVSVQNTGKEPGKSVVQVYGQSPYTEEDRAKGIEKASVQLLGYAKTAELAPEETAEVDVGINMELLATYDYANAGTYIMEPADNYYFSLGCNPTEEGAHAAVNNILAAKGYSPSENSYMDEAGDANATYKFAWDEEHAKVFSTYTTYDEKGEEVSKPITNQLQLGDLNNLKANKTVTYLSRNDWTWSDGTKSLWNTRLWSKDNMKGYTGLEATQDMLKQLANKTYVSTNDPKAAAEVKYGQDNGLSYPDMFLDDGEVVPYDDPKWDELMEELDIEEAIQFIINGNSEYLPMKSITFLGGEYAENGPTGLQMTIPDKFDASWSVKNDPNKSYAWNDMGCAQLQASTYDQELLEDIGILWGNDALYVNLPMLWAPALNLHRTPYNGRIAEYYSEDSVLTGYSAASVSLGAQSKGFIVTIKHFAFNDEESNRCGMAVFLNEQQARENELRGFQIAVEHGQAKAVMSSFNRVGCRFSSADPGLISNILRGEWGFNGYLVTDLVYSRQYVTFAEAVSVGTTNFDETYEKATPYWGTSADIAKAYANDPVMLQAIKDSVHHALWAFAHSNIANYMSGDVRSVYVMNWWRTTYISLESIGGIIFIASLLLYILALVFSRDCNNPDTRCQDCENCGICEADPNEPRPEDYATLRHNIMGEPKDGEEEEE
ncbi:MAG: glycoside hydrolase family 3 C-terminal domain-containing protein [Clostridia bacterium]|nr:glycoside hydrolase family 3 C-terminal domain-containing protein [Clostridia bacterium]